MTRWEKLAAALRTLEKDIRPETAIDSMAIDSLEFLDLLLVLDIEDVDRASQCRTLGELAEMIP